MAHILAIVAHPDDEVLGAGATLARHAMEGDTVTIAFMADGEASRGSKDGIAMRKEAAKASAKIIGAQECRFFSFPDNAMDSVPLLEISQKIESVIADAKPDTIYTHNPEDLNIDHQLTARAVMTAARPVWPFSIGTILAFETLSSTEWSAPVFGNAFAPDYYVECEVSWNKKLDAMECYKNEMRPFPHPRSKEAIDGLGIYRGIQAGFKKAEAFKVLRISR